MWIFKICCTHIEIQNSKAQTLPYIGCTINAKVGTNRITDDTIVSGVVPKNSGYIPVVISQSITVNCINCVFWDSSSWIVKADAAQRISIRFYNCIK